MSTDIDASTKSTTHPNTDPRDRFRGPSPYLTALLCMGPDSLPSIPESEYTKRYSDARGAGDSDTVRSCVTAADMLSRKRYTGLPSREIWWSAYEGADRMLHPGAADPYVEHASEGSVRNAVMASSYTIAYLVEGYPLPVYTDLPVPVTEGVPQMVDTITESIGRHGVRVRTSPWELAGEYLRLTEGNITADGTVWTVALTTDAPTFIQVAEAAVRGVMEREACIRAGEIQPYAFGIVDPVDGSTYSWRFDSLTDTELEWLRVNVVGYPADTGGRW